MGVNKAPVKVTRAWGLADKIQSALAELMSEKASAESALDEVALELSTWPDTIARRRLVKIVSRFDRALAEKHHLVKKRKL